MNSSRHIKYDTFQHESNLNLSKYRRRNALYNQCIEKNQLVFLGCHFVKKYMIDFFFPKNLPKKCVFGYKLQTNLQTQPKNFDCILDFLYHQQQKSETDHFVSFPIYWTILVESKAFHSSATTPAGSLCYHTLSHCLC